jgi:hypothetical protein
VDTQAKANIVRSQHVRAGGSLTTRQLATLLGVSQRAILGYLLNQIASDPAYTPKRKANSLPLDLIVDMHNAGISIDAISRFYAVSPARISYQLKRKQKA